MEALPASGVDVVPLRMTERDPWRFDRRVLWDQLFLPLAAAGSGARLLHCTSGSIPLIAPLPVVATVHDVAWLRGAQTHAPSYARWYFGAFSASRWRAARGIMVDSQFTRDELFAAVDLDRERVTVVYPGVDAAFARVARKPDSQKTLLCVGTVERRKNLEIVIKALPSLGDVKLLCVGPPTPYQRECAALAESLGVAGRVVFAGYVENSKLIELYANATLAVAPSRYEGFGYAAAQALCAGIPLVAARSSSLVEVVGDDAPLVDPDDAAAWASAIGNVLTAPAIAEQRASDVRSRAIARFSWSAAASAVASVYKNAILGL